MSNQVFTIQTTTKGQQFCWSQKINLCSFVLMEDRNPADTIGPISTEERQYAVDLLKTTQKSLNDAVAGLSEEQQHFKPAPDRWSVLECVEHIVLVEKALSRTIQTSLTMPADLARRATVKVSDVQVIKSVRSRNRAISAPPPFEPTGRYQVLEAAMKTFNCQRNAAIAYVEAMPDDLRLHYFQHFVLGTLDAYQAILLLASHGERHRKQIEEIKAVEGFLVG
jgi:uncharacterized damage-inducible protein DinB